MSTNVGRIRSLAPEIAVTTTVLVYGSWSVIRSWQGPGYSASSPQGSMEVVLLLAAASGLFRARPAVALALCWMTLVLHFLFWVPITSVHLVALLVAYGAARHGSRATVALSLASIPLSAGCAALLVLGDRAWVDDPLMNFVLAVGARSVPTNPGLLLLALLALGVPWFVGLLLRTRTRARASELATERVEEELHVAEQLVEVRAEQARLARDVHDVVGHSLAVVLAQAESAQFLPDDDTERIKATLANIATSARASLRDVRQVLASTAEDGVCATVPEGGLDSLIGGVRAAGREVHSRVEGTPRPLPPELDLVSYRVLQEMLTNALRHGVRAEPVVVERHWQGELRIEVRNVAGDGVGLGEGQGLDGMRRRLEAVGGRLDVRPREENGARTFTVTALMPTRSAELGR